MVATLTPTGEYNVYNALGVIAACNILDINNEAIQEGILNTVVRKMWKNWI